MSDFPDMVRMLENVLDRAENPNPDNYKASYKNCSHCARKPNCPTLQNLTSGSLTVQNPELSLPEAPLESSSPEQLSQWMDLSYLMESQAKMIKSYVMSQRLHNGVNIPGYELGHRKGNRKIVDAPKLVEVAKAFGLSDADVVECSRLYLTKLERAVRDVAPSKDIAHELPADYEPEKLISYGADGRLSIDPDIAGLTKAQRAKLFTFVASDALAEGDETPVLKRLK